MEEKEGKRLFAVVSFSHRESPSSVTQPEFLGEIMWGASSLCQLDKSLKIKKSDTKFAGVEGETWKKNDC